MCVCVRVCVCVCVRVRVCVCVCVGARVRVRVCASGSFVSASLHMLLTIVVSKMFLLDRTKRLARSSYRQRVVVRI